MGNHDAGRTNYERKIEVMKFDSDVYTREQALEAMKEKHPNCQYKIEKQYSLSHAPFEYWKVWADNKLFDEIYEGALIIGEKIILSHEPVSVPWAFNIHGHDHAGAKRANHLNVCSDVIGYKPVNLNQFLKSGALSKIQTIHRETIDNATKRKQKRGGKKIGKR
jgi:calcineurin-like phosphoesterase family protein